MLIRFVVVIVISILASLFLEHCTCDSLKYLASLLQVCIVYYTCICCRLNTHILFCEHVRGTTLVDVIEMSFFQL